MTQLPKNEVPWPRPVRTPAEAVRFIDAVGFCMLFPVKNVSLPSLYYAVTRRTVGTWDKLTAKLWGWKDELGRHRRAYYGKYFKMRGTFISLEMLPHFLAMRATPAAPADFDRFYAAGRISHDARALWKALASHGPLATLELRHACRMDTQAGNRRYKRAMLELQCLLIVVHSGTAQETAAWASGRFELTARAFPRQVRAARSIPPERARARIAAKYLDGHPAAPPGQIARLFGWSKGETLAGAAAAIRSTSPDQATRNSEIEIRK